MSGILAIYNDIDVSVEDQFNQWYNRQHLAERVAVTGFHSGRRYRGIEASHRYFAWYETDSSAVLRSNEYLERLEDPTRWTRQIMPNFRNMVRTVMSRSCRVGEGFTGFVGTVAVRPANPLEPAADATREWLASEGLGDVVDGADIVAAEYWVQDVAHADAETTESRLRGTPDASLGANIVLHASSTEATQAVFERLRTGVEATGAVVDGSLNRFALILSAS